MAEYVYGTDGHEGHWLTGEHIVRCRDCKMCELHTPLGHVFYVCNRLGEYPHVTDPDGFCSWGERKEVDE